MSFLALTRIDPDSFREAATALRLHTEAGYDKFSTAVTGMHGNSHIMKGYSRSTFRDMVACKKAWPTALPYGIAEVLFLQGHDVSPEKVFSFFNKLGFDIQFACGCAPNNQAPNRFTLEHLRFEIHEADAVADDPEDETLELELKVGFDRLRLTIIGDGLQHLGDFVACKTPDSPEDDGPSDDSGWFRMRSVSTEPLAWVFEPKEDGQLLSNVVKVEGKLAEVSTSGDAPFAIISALREALKVRVVDPVERRAPKALIDEHRDKMCAAVAERSLGAGAPEFVLHSVRL